MAKGNEKFAIDKVKLHNIAVNRLIKSGCTPKEEVASLRSGGKTVEELINYCKQISQKEQESNSDNSIIDNKSSDNEGSQVIHHPFRLRDAPHNIVVNIKNTNPLQVVTPQDKLTQSSPLRLQFPVSSGSHHRAKESLCVSVQETFQETFSSVVQQSLLPFSIDRSSQTTYHSALTAARNIEKNVSCPASDIKSPIDQVFPDFSEQKVDISQVMTERMHAVQKLQQNPNDSQALNAMYKAQKEVNLWAQSKQLPGQFTGSTGAKIMTLEELNGPDKRFQAWVKKQQLLNAAPVKGGIGMHLLQKMGWREGEGLGKHNKGSTEPITVNVKVDRKGLTSQGEDPKKSQAIELAKHIAGKHPVSALVELSNKFKWGIPIFKQIEEEGPDHKKTFKFKVSVNNITYQPATSSNSKKNGRAKAAIVCLHDLGLLPKDFIL